MTWKLNRLSVKKYTLWIKYLAMAITKVEEALTDLYSYKATAMTTYTMPLKDHTLMRQDTL